MTKFSYQLYSSRNFPPATETLRMLGELGYDQVEGYGSYFNDFGDDDALRGAMKDAGLTMPSCHMSLDFLRADPKGALERINAFGIKHVLVPHIDTTGWVRDTKAWMDLAANLAEISKPYLDAGLTFGWHNHDFEFTDTDSGQKPMEILLDNAPNLSFEFDIAWAARVGIDPLPWIDRYSDRLVGAHLKDLAASGQNADEDGWADMGDGILDWKEFMAALRNTSAEIFVMEHDNPNDHKRFATRSLAAARAL